MDMTADTIRLYHGSSQIVREPVFGVGNPYNDYGLGFYCTEDIDLARGWACPTEIDGFANAYELDPGGLDIIMLSDAPSGVLAWLSLLVKNRRFEAITPLAASAKTFLLQTHLPDVQDADALVGYRADDSYFSFARAFLDNRISLRQLDQAMRLGNLGNQVVIRSRRAFDALQFIEAEGVQAQEWHPRRWARDQQARQLYRDEVLEGEIRLDDVFVLDLMREAGWKDAR